MRLDKFLKTSLIFKTRSSGEKLIDNGKVMINNQTAKPSSSVKVNDTITVIFPLKKITYRVLMIAEKNVSRQLAREMFEIIHEESYEL